MSYSRLKCYERNKLYIIFQSRMTISPVGIIMKIAKCCQSSCYASYGVVYLYSLSRHYRNECWVVDYIGLIDCVLSGVWWPVDIWMRVGESPGLRLAHQPRHAPLTAALGHWQLLNVHRLVLCLRTAPATNRLWFTHRRSSHQCLSQFHGSKSTVNGIKCRLFVIYCPVTVQASCFLKYRLPRVN